MIQVMNENETRTILDEAMMSLPCLSFRRAHGLVMHGWQECGDTEGIVILIETEILGFKNTYDKFYNVVTLTEDGKYKVNIYSKDRNEFINPIEDYNEYAEEEVSDTFDTALEALELGYKVVDLWDLDEYTEEY